MIITLINSSFLISSVKHRTLHDLYIKQLYSSSFLSYGQCLVPKCPDKGGLSVDILDFSFLLFNYVPVLFGSDLTYHSLVFIYDCSLTNYIIIIKEGVCLFLVFVKCVAY